MRNEEIFWVNSEGGPLVILPKMQADFWKGSLLTDHYDLICHVEDYLSILTIDGCMVIVLGDEPLETCALTDNNRLFLIRCYWLDDEENFYSYFEKIRSRYVDLEVIEQTEIKANDKQWVIFDGAYTIDDAQEKLYITLPNTQCKINTYKYQEEKASFLIHIFES